MDDRKPIEQWIYHRELAAAATSIVAAEVESLAKTQRITEKRNDRQSEWRLILLGVLARERKLIYLAWDARNQRFFLTSSSKLITQYS